MTEVKPIVVIYYNPEIVPGDINSINERMTNKFFDYHVLAVPSYQSMEGSCETVELKVFNAKDLNEVAFEEFKKSVIDQFEKL